MTTLVTDLDLPYADPLVMTDREHLTEALAAARSAGWLARTDMGYALTRYEDIVALLRDRRFHSAASLIPEMAGMPDLFDPDRPTVLTAEGEVHGRLRRLVAPAFTPRAADRLRPFMREVIEGLVDPIVERGHSEFVADVCEPYPIPIISRLLGAPREDWKLFSRWATDLLRIFNGNFAEDLPAIVGARQELDEYMRELIAQRRAHPADDLLSDLIAAEEAGDRLSAGELLSMAEAVMVGGTDTTRNQLGCAVALFTEHPDQWALLGERPELAQRAVEEAMRYLGAVRGTLRYASEDIELKGVLFPKGTLVGPVILAGNFDESVFGDPLRFDITREATSSHLTFGSGIHYCLGAWLARAELQEALAILARRLPGLAADGPVVWKPPITGIWGPERLPIRFG